MNIQKREVMPAGLRGAELENFVRDGTLESDITILTTLWDLL
jgi:hypothetical protein